MSNDCTTIVLQLKRGYSTMIDQVDADLLEVNWHVKVNQKKHVQYVARTTQARPCKLNPKIEVKMHRVILERMLGRPLERNEQVDHIDGDGLNNRRSNLRLATNAQNCANRRRRSDNRVGYKGVSRAAKGNKWQAYIFIDGHIKSLGYYKTPEAAHEAYKVAATKHYGEFARFQ